MDDEESILRYARDHGLCSDFTCESPLLILSKDELAWSAVGPADLNANLSKLFNDRKPVKDEWAIDKGSARLLQTIICPPVNADSLIGPAEHSRPKLDLPLLHSDAELDYEKWRIKSSMLRPSGLEQLLNGLRPWPIENHSSFAWPLMDSTLLDKVQLRLASEKLPVSQAALVLLKQIILPAQLSEASVDDVREPAALQRFASPLLPRSPTPSLIAPNDCPLNLDLPLASSPVDLSAQHLAAVHDSMLFERLSGSDVISSPVGLPALPTESTHEDGTTKRNAEDLKMDLPLTPHTDFSSPFKKVKLSDLIPADAFSSPSATLSSDEKHYQQLFDDLIDLSAPAIKAIENEQLLETDISLRIQVPYIMDVDVTPPWQLKPGSETRNDMDSILAMLKDGYHNAKDLWPHTNLHHLCWNPIPHTARQNAFSEQWDTEADDQFLDTAVLEPAHTDAVVLLESHPRILDLGTAGELELKPCPVEIDEETELPELLHHQRHAQNNDPFGDTRQYLLPHNALDSFFSVWTGSAPSKRASKVTCPVPAAIEPPKKTTHTVPPQSTTPSLAPIAAHLAPRYMVVAQSLLADRMFMLKLISLLPHTAFLERALPAAEADIILAPGVGMILTTLQSIKQRPLPGQPVQKSVFTIRLASLRDMYDVLYIVVAAGDRIDESDTSALNGLAVDRVRVLVCSSVVDSKAHFIASLACSLGLRSTWRLPGDGQEDLPGEELLRAAGVDGLSALVALSTVSSISELAACSRRERDALLSHLIGRKALDRITRMFETPWDH